MRSEWDSNPRPIDLQSTALPLSYHSKCPQMWTTHNSCSSAICDTISIWVR